MDIGISLPDPHICCQPHEIPKNQRNLLHIESNVEESQVELDIEIRRTPPKFAGTCRKNQSRYDNKRKLFDSAHQIVKELGA
jgi:hypothetical protein